MSAAHKNTWDEPEQRSALQLARFHGGMQRPDYVIDQIIQRGWLYACTSITGHGKTSVWLFNAYMVALKRQIGTLRTLGGKVLYLAGENPDDLCRRSVAQCAALRLSATDVPLFVLPERFPIDEAAANALKRQIEAEIGEVVLIIGDTAAAYFPGEDDNANVPMGQYARDTRILTTCRGNPAVVMLCHPVKNPARDNLLPRGGGAYLNELDGNLTLWSEAVGESTTLHHQGKLRGADFEPIHYSLRSVDVPGVLDTWNRPIKTVICDAQSPEMAAHNAEMTLTDENCVLHWLKEQPGITIRDLARNANWTSEGRPHVSKVHRHLVTLKRDKLVINRRGKWVITDAGKEELKAKR